MQNKKDQIKEFLKHSNWIEREYSTQALEDAQRAWRYAYKNRDKITIDYILEIHRLLLRNIDPDIAGKIRTADVWIGDSRKMFISEALIKQDLQMKVCFEMIAHVPEKDKEEKTKSTHIAFEFIHPFFDGNGRTGRILWQIHRLRLGLPVKIIRGHKAGQDWHEEQAEYYKWFK